MSSGQSQTAVATTGSSSLADILERILDKGLVIAGDITISITDIELLTIKIRLVICSVDKAREIGIDWWRSDPALSHEAKINQQRQVPPDLPSESKGKKHKKSA